MAIPINPLTDKHRQEINRHLRTLEDVDHAIGQAELAGTPDSAILRARCKLCQEALTKIKAAYFPGKT